MRNLGENFVFLSFSELKKVNAFALQGPPPALILPVICGIIVGMERLNFVSQDQDFLRAYHMREMAMSDWTTGVNTAKEKGRMERELEIAKNSLGKGLSVELIQEITGLDRKTIESLQ